MEHLIDGIPAGEGLTLRAMVADEVGTLLALRKGTTAALSARGGEAFLLPASAAHFASAMAARRGEVCGPRGMTVGVFTDEGILVASAAMDLVGAVTPIPSADIASTSLTRDQVAYTRSTVVSPAYRRRGLASLMLQQRIAAAEALSRVTVCAADIHNLASRRLILSRGLVIVDVGENPSFPGAFSFAAVSRPAPGRDFELVGEARPVPISADTLREELRAGAAGVGCAGDQLLVRTIRKPAC